MEEVGGLENTGAGGAETTCKYVLGFKQKAVRWNKNS